MIRLAEPDDLGPALSDLRSMFRLNRGQLAELAGISQQQYGQYELGRRAPSVETLGRIAHALGYDLALIPREEA